MDRSTRLICAVFIGALTVTGVASAEGRGRGGAMRTIGIEKAREAARTARPANTVITDQQGSGHAASVVQTGTGNAAGILQFGRANTGAITQTGSGNSACLIQAGRNLDGEINQAGDNQTTGLLQTRWGSSEIPADLCVTATTRDDVMAYAPERPADSFPNRRRRPGRLTP